MPDTSPAPAGPQPVAEPRQAKLYRISGIGICALLSAPFAGGVLLAINERRLGNAVAAKRALVLSGLLTLALFAAGCAAKLHLDAGPSKIVAAICVILGAVVTTIYARRSQANRIRRHVVLGGRTESNGLAVVIGLLFAIGIVVLSMVLSLVLQFAGVMNVDDEGHVVRALPPPTEVTLAPGWIVIKDEKDPDYTGYSIERYRHGSEAANIQVMISPRSDPSFKAGAAPKEVFEDFMEKIQGDVSLAQGGKPEPVEFQINGKPSVRTEATYLYDGRKVRQQRVMTLGDKNVCMFLYTSTEDTFANYQSEAQAVRDSLKCS